EWDLDVVGGHGGLVGTMKVKVFSKYEKDNVGGECQEL
ncbi:hypothetical protein L195_g038359, partial [Trifolium pratense]